MVTSFLPAAVIMLICAGCLVHWSPGLQLNSPTTAVLGHRLVGVLGGRGCAPGGCLVRLHGLPSLKPPFGDWIRATLVMPSVLLATSRPASLTGCDPEVLKCIFSISFGHPSEAVAGRHDFSISSCKQPYSDSNTLPLRVR